MSCCLTFELSGRRRQDARPGLAKMYRVPPDRAWWPAVGAPLERGVRQRVAVVEVQAKCSRSNSGALTRQPRRRHEETASPGDGWPALTRAGTGAWTRLWPGRVAAEGIGKKRRETSNVQRRMSQREVTWPSRLEACQHCHLALPNVRAKLAPTLWRAGRLAQNGPKALRRTNSVTRRWCSA